ncbi:hypothetical protein K388_05917 [Streptomyces sp. KhCrAH-43]|nr:MULTISPECIES: hypothetical protein [unclassified Streptomyces]RAJ52817.1 hypothetical protein K388_05917 [Streptomyces sp. KhCrAH-43]
MPNRTHSREFERSLQRTKAAFLMARGPEGTLSGQSVNVDSRLGGA